VCVLICLHIKIHFLTQMMLAKPSVSYIVAGLQMKAPTPGNA
jgi:hypothetical protein